MNTMNHNEIAEIVMDIEHANNERWNQGDCYSYLDSYSDDISYFDPITAKLLVGKVAVEKHILTHYKNPNIIRSEYIDPNVAISEAGDLAVLSYNLRNFVVEEHGEEQLQTFWNLTAVFRQINGKRRTVNAHWSFVQHPGIMSRLVHIAYVR